MLLDTIDKEISSAMHEQKKSRLNTLRLIKKELVDKSKDGTPLTEEVEGKILLKMKVQREESIKIYKDAKREDLAEQENEELLVINEFAPKLASDDDVRKEAEKVINEVYYGNVSMKDMKNILNIVKSVYPTANGKVVSDTVKSYIK
jgi:hypothetical protein